MRALCCTIFSKGGGWRVSTPFFMEANFVSQPMYGFNQLGA